MKKYPSFYFLVAGLAILLYPSSNVKGQTSHTEEDEKGAHKITLGMGHVSHIKSEETSHFKEHTVGAYLTNYDYFISSHWAPGSHNDVIIEDIEVPAADGKEHLEHERPVASKLVASYKPGKHASIMLGLGDEFAHHKNIFMSTVGLDYGFHLKGGWELGGEFSYDLKFHDDDTWVVGIGLSKFIFSKHH